MGVDNIFILVATLDRMHSEGDGSATVEESVTRTVGVVGPSMFMSTCAQATAFFLGDSVQIYS